MREEVEIHIEKPFALVVDDEEEWRKFARKILEALGFEVEEAESLPDASGALQDRDFDLHVFDNTLGPLTNMGADLIRTANLFRDEPTLVIVHSGDLTDRALEEVRELGGVYVKKDAGKNPGTLIAAVKSLMP